MLKVNIQELGSISILCLQGRIAVGEINTLRRAVHSQSDVKAIVLDLVQVIGIDAAGLGMLLHLREWSKRKGIDLRLMNVTERVRQVLKITCLNSVFEISSEDEVVLLATSGLETNNLSIVHCGRY